MKTYRIVEEHEGKVEKTFFTSTRKREIKTLFNRFMRELKKNGKYSIEVIREGYARYTFNGTYATLFGEYYIVCE